MGNEYTPSLCVFFFWLLIRKHTSLKIKSFVRSRRNPNPSIFEHVLLCIKSVNRELLRISGHHPEEKPIKEGKRDPLIYDLLYNSGLHPFNCSILVGREIEKRALIS